MENEGGFSGEPVNIGGPEQNIPPRMERMDPIQNPDDIGAAPRNPRPQGAAKLIGIALVVLLLVGGGVFGLLKLLNKDKGGTVEPEPEPEKPVVVENDELAVRFLQLENGEKNLIYSPLSIKYGLSLLDDGASGNTKTQIDTVLGKSSLPKYNNVADKLSVANAVFIKNDFDSLVLDTYKEGVTSKYDAELFFDDFADTVALDNWVNDKTFGLIKEMGVNVDDATQMVLSNALAIQMEWAAKFNGTTNGREFYLSDGTTMDATTMAYDETKSESVGYYTDDDVTMATIDLAAMDDGTQLEFIAVMPTSTDLKTYVDGASAQDIITKESKKTLAVNTEGGVDLLIPKFGFEYKLDFVNDLKTLGITDAFDRDVADFSRMANIEEMKSIYGEDEAFYVSDAIHKANIDFSEKGIKAAAVTAFVMARNSAFAEEPKEPVVIKIDHPFMFMIMDKSTHQVWFTGTVYEPNNWAEEEVQTYDF